MKKKKKIIIIGSCMFVLAAIIVVDYYSVISVLGIEMNNFNFNIWGIIINCLTVVVLYIITYVLIDKQNVLQNENRRNVAQLILSKAYQECLDEIEWMDKEDYRLNVINKIDFNDDFNKSAVYKRIIENPFENHDMILDFAKEGIIASVDLQNYLEIRKEFKLFIITSIVFYDKYDLALSKRDETKELILKVLSTVKK